MENQCAQQDLVMIKEMLCRLLGCRSIEETDDIYEAGLTSIMVLPFLAELEDVFRVTIPDDDFLDGRTPEALAKTIYRLREQSSNNLK